MKDLLNKMKKVRSTVIRRVVQAQVFLGLFLGIVGFISTVVETDLVSVALFFAGVFLFVLAAITVELIVVTAETEEDEGEDISKKLREVGGIAIQRVVQLQAFLGFFFGGLGLIATVSMKNVTLATLFFAGLSLFVFAVITIDLVKATSLEIEEGEEEE